MAHFCVGLIIFWCDQYFSSSCLPHKSQCSQLWDCPCRFIPWNDFVFASSKDFWVLFLLVWTNCWTTYSIYFSCWDPYPGNMALIPMSGTGLVFCFPTGCSFWTMYMISLLVPSQGCRIGCAVIHGFRF